MGIEEIFLVLTCSLFYLILKLTDCKPNKVRYYVKFFTYYFYGVFVSTLISFVLVWKGRDIRNLPLFMKWLRPMTKFHGTTWHLENAEVMDTCGRAVIISNHQSTLDILALIHASPALKIWMLAMKKEFLYMGTIGVATYFCGSVFIKRQNPKDAYESLKRAVDIMVEREAKIWVFPEGKRNNQQRVKLLPFKRGAFFIAVASQSPIIPVVISPYYFTREDRYIFKNGGHMIMRCLEPVPTTGLTADDVPALADRLHAIVLNAYEELSKEVIQRFPGAAHMTAGGE